MAAVVFFYVIRALLNYTVCFFGHIFGIRVEADIRRDLFTHMQEMSFDFYDGNRTGQLMSRLTSDLFELTELAHHGPEDIVTSTCTILGALIVSAPAQKLEAVRHYFGGVSLVAALVGPLPCPDAPLDIELGAFLHEALHHVRIAPPDHDVVPFGIFMLFSVTVLVPLRCREREGCNLRVRTTC